MFDTKVHPLAEFKLASDGAGSFEGYASAFGGVDSYGDTIDPGAYVDTIPSFLVDGFAAPNHDWANDIGYFVEAREDARGLYVVGRFHDDPDAQKVRGRVAKRLAEGKSVGLSIGYEAEAYEYRKVDAPVRGMFGEFTDKVRALTKIKLFEVSIVTVPADRLAGVTTAKDARFPDHAEAALAAVRSLVERSRSLADLRTKEGRVLSEANRGRLRSLLEALQAAGTDIEELIAATEPAPKGADLAALYSEFLRTQARLNGVAVGGG